MKKTFLALIALLGAQAYAGTFYVTLTNMGSQPLSPAYFCASNAAFDIFQIGGTASAGIKAIAEEGQVNPIALLTYAAKTNVYHFTVGPRVLTTGSKYTIALRADPLHPYLQFASMLGITNDGFIGESVSSMGLKLYSGAWPRSFNLYIYGDRAWDAGTEENTQNKVDMVAFGGRLNPADHDSRIRVHAGVPFGGDAYPSIPKWTTATLMAKIEVRSTTNHPEFPFATD